MIRRWSARRLAKALQVVEWNPDTDTLVISAEHVLDVDEATAMREQVIGVCCVEMRPALVSSACPVTISVLRSVITIRSNEWGTGPGGTWGHAS